MRKHLLPLTALAATVALALAACSGSTDSDATASGDSTAGLQTLVVGATAVPAGEIVQYIIDSGQAAAAGLDIQITEFSDYNTPNPALSEGATDVNLFQHKPFLDLYNENSGDDLVSVGEVYLPPLALYSKTVDSLDALPEGASIALPNDGSNESRALLLLQSAGLIEVADGGSTVADITSNPHGYQFLEVDAASLPAALDDQDAAIVNFSFASAAGLSSDLQLLSEGTDSPYFNILATRAELADDARVLAFYGLLTSAETQQWIEDEYNGLVVPVAVS
ncbi:MetQ/NlpA family ABC transporter substrate-binding protein [Demequina capsici]|uniref:Lipoprotein n=1 Tax=Demequina capsici TaxID=3075620 RepID=A0AA96FAS3_9MICO|nr:MetQ/NlpA family ABC transporter substrate-binding protein [Demequina sp. OYTSA14]WNM25211.1 MetQ/NlpA family ABC transporter substrate-binding protein [Demequina sp. OYTSA14]